MEKDEILASLESYLMDLIAADKNPKGFILIFENVDNELNIPKGSTKDLLPELSKKLSLKVQESWDTRVQLKRVVPFIWE